MNITVLCGGISPERDVSLRSGALVANALKTLGHHVALVDSFVGVENPADANFTTDPSPVPAIAKTEPNLDEIRAKYRAPGDRSVIGKGVIDLCRRADVVFIALHGGEGEGGQIQAALDCFGVRYTGSGHTAAGIALDKDLTKRLLRFAGVDTADWLRFGNGGCADSREKILKEIGIPCVIKPLTGGSSCGVTIVRREDELNQAIALAEKYQSDFIAEKFIPGRELTVGVLEDPETRRARALPAVEIIPRVGGYDYVNKYQAGATAEICPAEIPEDIAKRAAKIAETVHRALGLRGYSRTDIIYDESTGRLVTLEVNTSPGMTDTSLIPLEANAAGISFPRLCEIIAELGMTSR
jgi:D-alanine-D-alanine ligase